MITGAIKNKVDKIWTDLWAGGIVNPLTVIEQLTYLMFIRSLDEKDFSHIASIMLNDLAKALKEREMNFTYTPAAAAHIAKASYSVKFGARNMRRYIQREVEDALAEKIIADRKRAITQNRLSVKDGALVVDCM